MAWLPTSNVPIQFFANGVPASGYVLKFYQSGTSNNLAVATDSSGTPTVSTVTLNSEGYPVVSGNNVIIFVDQAYKVALYPNAAAASSNTGAIWTIDGIDLSDFASLPAIIADIAALTPTDGNFIVGDGTTWVTESGSTVRTSLGLGSGNSPTFTNVTLSGLTTGHVVLANSAGALTALDVTAKGSLIVGDGAGAPIALPVGADGQTIEADSTAPNGVKWATPVGRSLPIVERTSNTILGASDTGKYIKITSGTFSQTFDAVATLAANWFVYLHNAGTGLITLDPNSTEQIDGLSTYVMYPGEARLIQCDGTKLTSIVLNAFSYTFTTSGTFTKPPGYHFFDGLDFGGGGGGVTGYGGGGGACVPFHIAAADVSASETVTIAAGGATGAAGGNSTFGSLVTAYGGAGGQSSTSGGGGGGIFAAASAGSGGSPAVDTAFDNPGYGGGNGRAADVGTRSVYGGGGGGGGAAGGDSIFGGGGGGTTGGTSIYAGAGGETGTNGSAPSGGGGAGATSGARGEIRIWGIV